MIMSSKIKAMRFKMYTMYSRFSSFQNFFLFKRLEINSQPDIPDRNYIDNIDIVR